MRPIRMIVTAAALAVLITPLVVPAPADADPITGVTCAASTYSSRFNPGLTLTPQTVAVTVEFRLVNCLSLSQPGITSGTMDKQVIFNDFSCLSLALPVQLGTVSIHWSNGQTSMVNLTLQIVGVAVIAFGPVASGVFAGKQFTAVLTALPITTPVECLTPQGAKQITGVIDADIT